MTTDASTTFMSLKELAIRLGMDRSHARRYVLGLGFRPQKRRTQDSANQLTLTLTMDEAEAVIERRMAQGFLATGTPVAEEHGYFYVIALVPELAKSRLKLGFAISVEDRLQQHRTAAPTATVLKAWPCRRSWELAAIDCATKEGCALIANEVFECEAPQSLLLRLDNFFGLMPLPAARIGLADCSPINPPSKR